MAKKKIKLEGPELIVGLVGAIGTDLELVCDTLSDIFLELNYKSEIIRLSDLLLEIDKFKNIKTAPLNERYKSFMDAGDLFRQDVKRGDALTILSISAIQNLREKYTGNKQLTVPRLSYILRQLKRPEEVETLRSIYGHKFLLIAVYSARKNRLLKLAEKIAESHAISVPQNFLPEAESLMIRDENDQGTTYGQNVRDTFPLADLFVADNDRIALKREIKRFIEIIFGYPFETPRRDEYSMFHAQAAALRSASLSRQVGAVISNDEGDIISIGTNEVPKAGGGSYWSGDKNDKRDHIIGYEISDKLKKNIFSEVLQILKEHNWLAKNKSKKTPEDLVDQAMPMMRSTQVMNLIEFGRPEHAEMSAFLDAARRGVSVKGCTLFTTTYPCHNCARHIVTSGIKRVVYIEPYPKSKALILHDDAITENMDDNICDKVKFEPFIGISPRRYFELFTFSKSERVKDGQIVKWERTKTTTNPRFMNSKPHYRYCVLLENEVLDKLYQKMKEANLKLR